IPLPQIAASFQRLAAGRVLVLDSDSGEILMANPFSAVPTPFLVEFDDYACYGNCIWDAMGVVAMRGRDAHIKASCGDCGSPMEVRIVSGALQSPRGVAHYALPARRWWDDIVFN
ncbi:MAG TPA: organomercurial lyase, partial [bacterium]|nr:organomercurial lyase [bacterium]